MICNKCDKELPDGAVFCAACGSRLDAIPNIISPKPSKRSKKPLIISAISLVLVVGIVLGIVFSKDLFGSSKSSSAGSINYKDAYNNILVAYEYCVQEIVVNDNRDISDCPWALILELTSWESGVTASDFGYAFYDINDNGSKELILHTKTESRILGIYSLQNGEPYSIINVQAYRELLTIQADGTVVTGGSSGAGNSVTVANILDSDDKTLTQIEEYGSEDVGEGPKNYRIIDGAKTYYDANEDFSGWFVSDIPHEELELEFNAIIDYNIQLTENEDASSSYTPQTSSQSYSNNATSYSVKENGEYSYYKYADHIEIIGYLGSGGNIKIPSVIDGLPVTKLKRTFLGRLRIYNVEIPSTVTEIGTETFYGCEELTSVTIPNSVTIIGERAFRTCKSLTAVSLPEGVTSIGVEAFQGCYSITEFHIPDNIAEIPEHAFYDCKKLRSITFPKNLKKIGVMAFAYCENLKTLRIPDTIETVEQAAFAWCDGLTDVFVPESVETMGTSVFAYSDGLLTAQVPKKYSNTNIFKGCSYKLKIEWY